MTPAAAQAPAFRDCRPSVTRLDVTQRHRVRRTLLLRASTWSVCVVAILISASTRAQSVTVEDGEPPCADLAAELRAIGVTTSGRSPISVRCRRGRVEIRHGDDHELRDVDDVTLLAEELRAEAVTAVPTVSVAVRFWLGPSGVFGRGLFAPAGGWTLGASLQRQGLLIAVRGDTAWGRAVVDPLLEVAVRPSYLTLAIELGYAADLGRFGLGIRAGIGGQRVQFRGVSLAVDIDGATSKAWVAHPYLVGDARVRVARNIGLRADLRVGRLAADVAVLLPFESNARAPRWQAAASIALEILWSRR